MSEQWYSNKDLLEKISDLREMFMKEIPELRLEMKETKDTIKKYNGLREAIGKVENKVKILQEKDENKKEVKKDWQFYLGWVVGVAGLLIAVYK